MEVVALADGSVEVGARVAGPHVDEVQLRVEGAGDPAVAAASLPGLAVVGPRLGPGLAGLGHHVGPPHALAGLAVERLEVAAVPELPAGAAGDDHVLDDQRSHRGALAGPHVAVGRVPDLLAGLGVERDEVGGQGGDEDLALGDRDAAVHVAAAQRHVERRRGPVLPQDVAGPRVEGPDPAVPARDVHDAVDDERGGLERVRRLARVQAHRAALEDPLGRELADVLLGDLVERAVALPVVGAVVGEPVLRLRAGVEDALVGDPVGHRRRAADDLAEGRVADRLPCIYVVSCHLVLLRRRDRAGRSSYGRGCGGRSWRASGGASPPTTIAAVRPRPSSLPEREPYQ